MERKTIPFFATKVDEEQGIVDHIVSVFGVIDEGKDIVHPGAFVKTIAERGHKIRVLDQHRMESVRDVVGKPLMLQEVGRDALPSQMLVEYPEAMGGLKASTQFLLDTPEGLGVFRRIKAGAVNEWSFAYDPLDYDHENIKVGEQSVNVRNLRTLRLWEYGPVIFGMNPATTTIGAKQSPAEAKPWDVFLIDGEHCVYRVNEQGEHMGDALGCHATEEEARDQVAALYASEEAALQGDPDQKGVSGSTTLPIASGDDTKSVYIDGITAAVRQAFYSQYPDVTAEGEGQPWQYFWVKEVWDDFVIVEEETQDGRYLWKIGYGIEDEAPVFADRSEWIQGVMMFVPLNIVGEDMVVLRNPIAPAAELRAALEAPPDTKAGPAGSSPAGNETPPTSMRLEEIEAELLDIELMEVNDDLEREAG